MRNVLAIARRELGAFFVSPLAYVIIAFFLAGTALFFGNFVRWYADLSLQAGRYPELARELTVHEALVRPLYDYFQNFLFFIVPLLSMRLLAEEKKQGTCELLLTTPVRTSELVLGKYAGALGFLAVLLILTVQYPLFLWAWGAAPPLGSFLSTFLGILLLGASFLSVGLFMSSLTENQIIAAVTSFVVLLVFWAIGVTGELVGGSLEGFLRALSLFEKAEDFSKGIIDTRNVVFFLTFIAFNLFLTQRAIDSRRWR